jgi:hypothetical protein
VRNSGGALTVAQLAGQVAETAGFQVGHVTVVVQGSGEGGAVDGHLGGGTVTTCPAACRAPAMSFIRYEGCGLAPLDVTMRVNAAGFAGVTRGEQCMW